MRKFFLISTLFVLLFSGCENKDDSVDAIIDVSIRVKNVSAITYEEVIVEGYAPALKYSNIAPDSISDYKKLQSNKRPDVFKLRTAKDTLSVVYDYTPSYYDMENGLYTLEVDQGLIINYIKD